MASFDIAYNKYIKPSEGGYVNIAADKGGETYAGIARNYHPGWSGWITVDFTKRTKGPIARNTFIPGLEPEVTQFYLDWWNSQRFGQIQSQEVANLLFDYNVNSSSLAIKAVQRIVGVPADGAMGPATIAAINNMDPAKLHEALKADRKKLYESIVARDPTQQVFWNGWMNRLSSFPTLTVGISTGIILLTLGAIALGFYLYQRQAVT